MTPKVRTARTAFIGAGIFACLILSSGLAGSTVINLSKPVSDSIAPDGLYWSFDDGVIGDSMPEVVADGSGNGYEGKLVAGGNASGTPLPVYTQGKFGTAMHFEGYAKTTENADGHLVNLWPNSRVFAPIDTDTHSLDMVDVEGFTAGVWLKLDEVKFGEKQTVVLFDRGMAFNGWYLVLSKNNADLWTMLFGIRNSEKNITDPGKNASGAAQLEAATEVWNDLQWHHVGVVCDLNAQLVRFYVDGVLLDEAPLTRRSPAEGKVALRATEGVQDRWVSAGESNYGLFSTGFIGALDDLFVTSGLHSFQSEPSKTR